MKQSDNFYIQIPHNQKWRLILPKRYYKDDRKRLVKLQVGTNQENKIVEIANRTLSYDTFPIMIKKVNTTYRIGPIVGIMTARSSQGIKGDKKNFQDIIREGIQSHVLIYVFTAEAIQKQNKTVKAYLYIPKYKKWITRSMPLPDIVYNRIPYRNEEKKPVVKEALKYLRDQGVEIFNNSFFDKWELYQWLRESSQLKKFLPYTAYLKNSRLYYTLNKKNLVYLKPIHGKAGIDFIRIERRINFYHLLYQTKKKVYRKIYHNYESLWKDIIHLTRNKEYIIQEGIKLKNYKGRPYDIRILVQKNGNGAWKVTGIGVRVAGEDSITTHVPRGGFIESSDRVFKHSFGELNANYLKSYLSDLAINIATFIEGKNAYNIGEMSMDIGIDQDNRVWFFEANAKPMKFDEPYIRDLSLQRLIQYFKYLSDF